VAKDGTNRGGRRVRAGDKPQPLADKITAGKAAKILEAPELQPESMLEAEELEDAADLYGEDMPAPSDYLSARQKDGKPLVAYPVLNSSMTGCIVLDPFGGSGSTLIACEQTGRICHTVELDEKFCDVIVKRYIEFKNSDAGVFLVRGGQKIPLESVEKMA
jgi:DNA modification methylase